MLREREEAGAARVWGDNDCSAYDSLAHAEAQECGPARPGQARATTVRITGAT